MENSGSSSKESSITFRRRRNDSVAGLAARLRISMTEAERIFEAKKAVVDAERTRASAKRILDSFFEVPDEGIDGYEWYTPPSLGRSGNIDWYFRSDFHRTSNYRPPSGQSRFGWVPYPQFLERIFNGEVPATLERATGRLPLGLDCILCGWAVSHFNDPAYEMICADLRIIIEPNLNLGVVRFVGCNDVVADRPTIADIDDLPVGDLIIRHQTLGPLFYFDTTSLGDRITLNSTIGLRDVEIATLTG